MQQYKNGQQNCSRLKTELFTQLCVAEKIKLPDNLPDIEQLISCVIDPEILSIKAIPTMKGLSYEGQKLTGKKAILELYFKQKLLYVSDSSSQSVHVIENELYQSAYIIIPCSIEGTDPDYLIKYKYLKPEVVIEDIYYRQINKRNIFNNITVMLQLILVPTYEICCAVRKNSADYNLYLMQEDGTDQVPICNNLHYKNIRPRWSSNGYEIAYLSNRDGNLMLYVYNHKTRSERRITDPAFFKTVTSFCWTADGNGVCFSGIQGNTKELFLQDTARNMPRQLTYGEGIYFSFKPKCSPDGTRIGFIRSFSELNDLWIMNTEGTGCKRLTDCGDIIGFDWSRDNRNIAYICRKEGKKDKIYITSAEHSEYKQLEICGEIIKVKKILYSPKHQYLAFLGSDLETDNIYLYNLESGELRNITQSLQNSQISDFVWKIDGTKIYYVLKELFHYDIYCVYLEGGIKTQLTFTNASDLELDYRPQIS